MKRTFFFCCLLLTSFVVLADTDVTSTYIENPDFEARFAGWNNNGFYFVTNSHFGQKHGKIYMERWVASGSRIPNVEISQDLYLPAGTYKLSAGCQNIQQSGQIDSCRGASLYVNNLKIAVSQSKRYDLTFTVLQGTTRIGFKIASSNANWAAIDNVKLTLLDTNIEAEHAELQKLIGEAESVVGEGEGAAELQAAINEANALIEAGSNEGIGPLAKRLSDATLNYRILNATGSTPRIVTNKFIAAGATVLLGRMTTNLTSGILEKGFCWSTNPEPTIFDNRSTKYFSANGEIYRMERLEPGTMYYVRPYILTNKYKLVYGDIIKAPTLPKGTVTADYDNGGSTEENYRIASAIEEIKWLYNNISSVRGINLSVHYSAGTPTADCSYGGWMRVGANESYQQTGTILHETNHGVGVGTSDVWWNGNYREEGDRGKWLGPRATQMIQFLNKDNNAYMTGDNTHMWPQSSFSGPNYGINGSWEDAYNPENTLLYYGNVLITHAMHQDGLVCSSSVGFASPAYTFTQEDDTKYYIKTTDSENGNETSLLYVTENGSLAHMPMGATKAMANDNCAWNIVYDPQTAYYTFRNVGTGRLLSCSNQTYRVVTRTTPSANERVQLLPSRSNFKKGNLDTPSYWITIGKKALAATGKTTFGGASFDASDSNASQHWLLLNEEEFSAFDSYCIGQTMPQLDDILAEARISMQTPAQSISEDISTEEAAQPMNDLMEQIEAEKVGYDIEAIENAIQSLRTTFADYIINVVPASQEQPIPISWLIADRNFGEYLETTFNTYQTLSYQLPAGNYVLTLNAFQRPGTNQETYNDWTEGKDVVKAQLYATISGHTSSQTILNIWDGASERRKSGYGAKIGNLYVPNNAAAAKVWFADSCYQNRLPLNLASPSTIKIGIRSTKTGDSWWTCYEGFGLHFYGPFDTTTGINDPMDFSNLNETIFDLSGRKLPILPLHKDTLPKGIYIINGKKMLVR